MPNIDYKILSKEEIEKFREIDRREIIEYDYYYKDDKLELKKVFFDVKGFNPDHLQSLINRLYGIYDNGGTIFGAFDDLKLVGLSALENKFRGENNDTLNYAVLHISKSYRKMGIGKKLSELVMNKAREMGAKKLYVSSAPTKNTVDFYMKLGCKLANKINKELYALEPDDIHLILDLYKGTP